MDPMETINIDGDSTFALMLEAQARGHTLWHYEVRHMALRRASPRRGRQARASGCSPAAAPVTVRARARRPLQVRRDGDASTSARMDVVLMRQDPPFDMAYITATHMLEHIQPGTLVVNDPAAVRNAPEKLLVTHFPDLMPPTLITWDLEAIRAFRAEYKDIIVKPLFGNGGAGVFRIKPDDENLASLLEMHFARSREPLMIQRYEPAVRQGDKRIILVDGEPMGAINRVPAAGRGALQHACRRPRRRRSPLTARDREICAAIGPTLREQGLIFVGIDVIGDYLTEINVTSPTGLQEIARFDGVHLEKAIWDRIEEKVVALRAAG